ncbi:MAG: glycosyltransferase family 2 protein [Saprospiraceae bacterium]|nr:glycosyltransferase family 2 protein [Saprospiraceae bacterium]
MKISAFSYIRNGFKYGYPFLQSIQSVLPLCDEFVIAVGDSEDGTKEAIKNLENAKIKIIDTIWDDNLRSGGRIFAQQSNIALGGISGDWAFHIQADEVLHEDDLFKIRTDMESANEEYHTEGLLFDFLNFHGSYSYLNNTRYQHRKEIRAFKNDLTVFSYRDSQGFRKYPSYEQYLSGHKGDKLRVKYIGVPIYHYSYVRNPKLMNYKSKHFETYWHEDKYVNEKYQSTEEFDYYKIARVKRFEGQHPAVMKDLVETGDWGFDPKKLSGKISIKDRILYWIEDKINHRIGEYKNYIQV